MFNRTEIMRTAWATMRRRPAFNRSYFAHALACAWRDAKLAAMTPAQRRVESIQAEIEGLRFKPWRINVATREQALRDELRTLQIAA